MMMANGLCLLYADAGRVENIDVYRAAKAFNMSVTSGDVIVKHTQEKPTENVM